MSQDYKRIKDLIERLDQASKVYYLEGSEMMSNYEYDALYDELEGLEKETGIVFSNSPTQKVGYQVLSDLPKEAHAQPMLSLNKTKVISDLVDFLNNSEGLLSWKLDGLTIAITYEGGLLTKAITRGNGEVGEVITNNVKVFDNVPLSIDYKSKLTVRGEAIIKYSDFDKINENLPIEEQYKNPRNLCSGTVRQLNNAVVASRHVQFIAFQMVEMDGEVFNLKSKQLEKLAALGFECVQYEIVDNDNIVSAVEKFQLQIPTNDFGSDGLVLIYNDIEYSKSLGRTSKFPKDAIAFKWEDEISVTTLIDIEWSASRTGLINPVAIFEPVELEGTTVARASLHNISIIESLELGIGDSIGVYKANMIIPQIAYNETKSNQLRIPKTCPVCGEPTEIKQNADVRYLVCNNSFCPAKMIKSLSHFVSRDAMNIDGLSEATLEKFIQQGFISTYSDIYNLEQYKEEIVTMEGFGEKSYENLMVSIQNSRTVNIANFIYALGISNVGLSNAKLLVKSYQYDLDALMDATVEELVAINTIGEVIAKSLVNYFDNSDYYSEIVKLKEILTFTSPRNSQEQAILQGKIFVITGSLEDYENRKALQAVIESRGGKVSSAVSNNTDYLINNDLLSNSSKNVKAKSLGVEIINEKTFQQMIEEKQE